MFASLTAFLSAHAILIAYIILIHIVFFALQGAAAVLVLAERKVAAFSQQRLGPYRVGWWGILQPIADIVKLLFKEELRPAAADFWLFYLAPVISATTAFAAFVVIPFGPPTDLFGLLPEKINLQGMDVNVGVLIVFAITSMGVYGIVLAGWASNSKYSLLGGLRSSAQMLSYELSYGLALASAIVLGNSLSLRQIVDAQSATWLGGLIPIGWFLWPSFFGFIIYMIAGVAETNRAPFDFPEAEQELVAGYHTEYSSMSFALFFLAEYINMVTVSAVATNLFLGGWHWPIPIEWGWGFGVLNWLLKVGFLLFFYIWMRWTLPRYRYDQLMSFGWKYLLPAAVLNIIAVAAGVIYFSMIPFDVILFYLFGGAAVAASIAVVAQRNPMHSVLFLIGSFAALAGLYINLDSPFTAVTQIIVYAGAIMVLFLFVVMLLNAPREDAPSPYGPAYVTLSTGPRKAFTVLSVILLVELAMAVAQFVSAAPPTSPAQAAHVSSVREIGISIFTDYSLAFEATSILILVAMVGAVVLAKKKV